MSVAYEVLNLVNQWNLEFQVHIVAWAFNDAKETRFHEVSVLFGDLSTCSAVHITHNSFSRDIMKFWGNHWTFDTYTVKSFCGESIKLNTEDTTDIRIQFDFGI